MNLNEHELREMAEMRRECDPKLYPNTRHAHLLGALERAQRTLVPSVVACTKVKPGDYSEPFLSRVAAAVHEDESIAWGQEPPINNERWKLRAVLAAEHVEQLAVQTAPDNYSDEQVNAANDKLAKDGRSNHGIRLALAAAGVLAQTIPTYPEDENRSLEEIIQDFNSCSKLLSRPDVMKLIAATKKEEPLSLALEEQLEDCLRYQTPGSSTHNVALELRRRFPKPLSRAEVLGARFSRHKLDQDELQNLDELIELAKLGEKK